MSIIPKGRYNARAEEAVMGRASTGNEQIAVSFRITDPESEAGRTITWYGYFTEKTQERTLESMDHMGWDGAGFGPDSLRSLSTNEVQIVIDHEEDQEGKPRARVQWVNRLGGGGPVVKEELDQRGVASLESRLKGELMKRRSQNQARGNGGTRPPSTPF